MENDIKSEEQWANWNQKAIQSEPNGKQSAAKNRDRTIHSPKNEQMKVSGTT